MISMCGVASSLRDCYQKTKSNDESSLSLRTSSPFPPVCPARRRPNKIGRPNSPSRSRSMTESRSISVAVSAIGFECFYGTRFGDFLEDRSTTAVSRAEDGSRWKRDEWRTAVCVLCALPPLTAKQQKKKKGQSFRKDFLETKKRGKGKKREEGKRGKFYGVSCFVFGNISRARGRCLITSTPSTWQNRRPRGNFAKIIHFSVVLTP